MSALMLPGLPAVGTFVRFGKQRFTCVGFEPIQRADGTSAVLAQWQSHCPSCGALFVITAPQNTGGAVRRRRCSEHLDRGRAVYPA